MSIFPPEVYTHRISAAQRATAEAGLDGLIIGTGAEFAYLTGLWISTHERLTALVIPAVGEPTVLIPAVDRGDVTLPGLRVRGWVDGENPHELAIEALGHNSPRALGIGSSISADHLIPLHELLGRSVRMVLAVKVLQQLFVVKDPEEIAQLREAGRAIDRIHEQVPKLLRPGRSEKEVAEDIRSLILQEHSAVDFIIVGSGPNGANPHHSFSERVLESGNIVVVDIGGTFGVGYHSDCTRTYVVSGQEAPEDFQHLYAVLLAAQLAACAQARPGVSAESVDRAAREIITHAGYGAEFIHRSGHGIGLSTHEEPFIMEGNELILAPGMTFSIEPGIYIEGIYGARIEDIVTITEDGCELLNNLPKELR